MAKYKRFLLPGVLFLLVGIAALTGVFQRLDLMAYDASFRAGGPHKPGNDVVIVAIDDASIRKLGSFPWQRSIHAKLLEKLKLARVIGFDLTFELPADSAEDDAFAAAIAENGKVVLSSRFSFERAPDGSVIQEFSTPEQRFLQGAGGLGFVNMATDIDGVVRRVSMVDVNTFEKPFPSFGLAVALKAGGFDQDSLKLEHAKLVYRGGIIPLDGLNRIMPSFWGPSGSFTTYSYKDIFQMSPERFKDKIVLIGDTTAASHDYFSTPLTTSNFIIKGNLPQPGVELHASIIESFLQNRWYQEVSPSVNLFFLFAVGLVTTLVVAKRGPWAGMVGMLGVVCLVAASVYGLWLYKKFWITPTAPVFLVFLDYAALTSLNFVQAELGRRRTKAILRRYVSPDVAEQLMMNPDKLSLGGNRQEVTIMFCDIRGFTDYSENKEPEQVVKRLNQYLSSMTAIIFKYGGTLDKYLGDGVMAVFGAPVYHPDHVQRALKTALEIQKEVEKLNRIWVSENEPPLKVGIGINSGSVLVGNVGSPERMDYTVIGEDVNLASRLETLTKSYGASIVLSERSVKMIEGYERNLNEFKFLGQAQVKGFTRPIGIYTVAEYQP